MAETSTTKKRRKRKLSKSTRGMEIPEHLNINKNDLDEEFLRQPVLVYEASVKQSEKQKDLDRAINKLKAFESTRREEIAESVDKYTERGLDAMVQRDDDVLAERQKIARLEAELAVATAEKAALYERGRALQSMVDLLKMNYYAPTGR